MCSITAASSPDQRAAGAGTRELRPCDRLASARVVDFTLISTPPSPVKRFAMKKRRPSNFHALVLDASAAVSAPWCFFAFSRRSSQEILRLKELTVGGNLEEEVKKAREPGHPRTTRRENRRGCRRRPGSHIRVAAELKSRSEHRPPFDQEALARRATSPAHGRLVARRMFKRLQGGGSTRRRW